MRNLANGKLRDVLELRAVCRFWKEGLDKLTEHPVVGLKGVTCVSFRSPEDLTHRSSNPFPTRIVQMKLCHEHDNPDKIGSDNGNEPETLFLQWYGQHIRYLQITLQHADCTESHFAKMSKLLTQIYGLVLSENVSSYRFRTRVDNDPAEKRCRTDPISEQNYEISKLENLKFLKFEHLDCEAKYFELYKKILENSPNLTHLELNGHYHLDMGIVRRLSNPQLILTKLKIDAAYPTTEETLLILSSSHFPLSYFSLRVNGFEDEIVCRSCSALLHTTLERCSSTLTRLELKLSWFEETGKELPQILVEFPSSKFLTKLERLKLVGYRGQLDFLKDFKSLKALLIAYHSSDGQSIFASEKSFKDGLPNLTEVYLPVQNINYCGSSDSPDLKEKMQNFMYAGDPSFIPKYTGLYLEGFP